MSEEQGSYIQQVHLKGYKSVKDLTVSFQKGLNIIIGANGSGKTNFMEFLDAAFNSNYERLLNNRKFEVEILSNSRNIKIISETNNSSSSRDKYKYKIIENLKTIHDNFTKSYYLNENKRIEDTEIIDSNGNKNEYPFFDFFENEILCIGFENPLNQLLKDKLKVSFIIWFEAEANEKGAFELVHMLKGNFLTEGAKSFINRVFDIFDYSEEVYIISQIISEIIENKLIELHSLKDNLERFSPIKDIKIDWDLTRKTIQKDEYEESLIIEGIDFQFFVNNEWLNWTQLSDGTKRLFYLIGSVTYAKENEIILMEEPELGVHPHQLTLLMNFLKAESETKQIIISTHSPQVLNCLKEDELDHIIVARHEGKAGTQMYHLSEEEKGYASEYMKNQAFLSDYWLQSGFMNEENVEQT